MNQRHSSDHNLNRPGRSSSPQPPALPGAVPARPETDLPKLVRTYVSIYQESWMRDLLIKLAKFVGMVVGVPVACLVVVHGVYFLVVRLLGWTTPATLLAAAGLFVGGCFVFASPVRFFLRPRQAVGGYHTRVPKRCGPRDHLVESFLVRLHRSGLPAGRTVADHDEVHSRVHRVRCVVWRAGGSGGPQPLAPVVFGVAPVENTLADP
jgi:hypothetical protein